MYRIEVKHDTRHKVWRALSGTMAQPETYTRDLVLYVRQYAIDHQDNPDLIAARVVDVETGAVVSYRNSNAAENRPSATMSTTQAGCVPGLPASQGQGGCVAPGSDPQLIVKLFRPKTGRTVGIRDDRRILIRDIVTGEWIPTGKIIASALTTEEFVARRRADGYRDYQEGDVPSFEEIRNMEFDACASATDGCDGIEPDGTCCHGAPSWVQALLSIALP
ncbi:hypothetical protein [Burkholderia sp. MBR-1]|uniref:hypothetical protein n=1 Tax=Burkholderia sp. MBR-1 TaxID=2732364 RepID=UPI0015EF91A0|nr:hypothetical protein [Burkholderia sp. MBR-1]QMI49739.1 hypothetical protein MBR110_30150 [Burkholderia sp. MBR-1]